MCCRIAALSLQSLSRVCDIAFLNNRVASSQGCYTIRFSLVRLEHSKLRSSWPRIDHSNDTYTIFFYSSTLLLSMYRHCGLGVFVMSHCTTIRFPVRLHVYTLRQRRIPERPDFKRRKFSRSPFLHTRGKEEQRFHETVSKVADTGRGGGSRALVAWLDRHAALPRDTLLKQRTTLKFSESTGCVCKGNKSWLLEMRGIVTCLEILNFEIGWKIFWNKHIDNFFFLILSHS